MVFVRAMKNVTLPDNQLRVPRIYGRMGNHLPSHVLIEEEEQALHIEDQNYDIHNCQHILKDCNTKTRTNSLDKWKMLRTSNDYNGYSSHDQSSQPMISMETSPAEEKLPQNSSSQQNVTQSSGNTSNTTNEKTVLAPTHGGVVQPTSSNTEIQKAHSSDSLSSTKVTVRKPRPNSLAIASLSIDFDLHTIPDNCGFIRSESKKEVSIHRGQQLSVPNLSISGTGASGGISTDTSFGLAGDNRSASAGTLLEHRPSLQQRRNQRPTSLQIPNILNIPPPPVRSSQPAYHQNFTFNSHSPVARQRSHSMPSNGAEVSLKVLKAESHQSSLDHSYTLLSKKKINKDDIDRQNLLHRACDAGHTKLVKKCLLAGCAINKRMTPLNGITALHCAVRSDKNSEQVTQLLLQSGIEVNAENDLGETAIFSAVIHKNTKCVELLVQHGCDVNSVWQQSTPLYLVLLNKDMDTTSLLLSHGARITKLPGKIRQPLHAVLEICHIQPINQRIIDLLELVIKADGDAVRHLLNYQGTKPGCSEQDLIYHIYRMEKCEAQRKGKKIIRSLIKLGYMPTRGELSNMSQDDTDYESVYDYVKSGPPPLSDLCIRTIRPRLAVNVVYAVERWPALPDKEKAQLLLQPPPPPEHEYENVVFRRGKGSRKSKRKTLLNLLGNINRLSKRLKKKDVEMKLSNGSTPGSPKPEKSSKAQYTRVKSLPPDVHLDPKAKYQSSDLHQDSKTKSKPPIKPKPKLNKDNKTESKPEPQNSSRPAMFQKKERRKSDIKEVKELVAQYSTSETSLLSHSSKETLSQASSTEALKADNKAFLSDSQDTNATIRFSSSIHIDNGSEDDSEFEDVVVQFDKSIGIRTLDRNHKTQTYSTGPRLTPMKDHAPDIGTGELSFKQSACEDNC